MLDNSQHKPQLVFQGAFNCAMPHDVRARRDAWYGGGPSFHADPCNQCLQTPVKSVYRPLFWGLWRQSNPRVTTFRCKGGDSRVPGSEERGAAQAGVQIFAKVFSRGTRGPGLSYHTTLCACALPVLSRLSVRPAHMRHTFTGAEVIVGVMRGQAC